MRTTNSFLLFILTCLCFLGVSGVARAQFKLELQTCDFEFINEYQQNIGEKNRLLCYHRRQPQSAGGHLFRLHHRLGQARNHGTSRQPD
jgi:hypothetical protein